MIRWPVFRAALAAAAIGLAADSQASEVFSPPFCDLAVTLPTAGARVEKSLDMRPVFTEATSVSYAAKNHMLRAQCARYAQCSGRAMQAEFSADDLRALSAALNFDPAWPVMHAFEQHPKHGRVGVIQGKAKFSGNEFDVRAAIFFGSCSRLALTFGSLVGTGDGWAEWTRAKNSVRAR